MTGCNLYLRHHPLIHSLHPETSPAPVLLLNERLDDIGVMNTCIGCVIFLYEFGLLVCLDVIRLSGSVLTVGATDTAITCTQTNSRIAKTVTLRKSWVNAKLSDAVDVTATGLRSCPRSPTRPPRLMRAARRRYMRAT